MSNIEKAKKKKGKGKTKGAKGMPIEDYARKNNLSLDVNLTYENDEEEPQKKNKKSNYLIYQENIIINRKNETPKKNKDISDKSDNNRKELEIDYNSSRSLNLEWHKQVSASTNNSSIDDENKNNNKEKKKNIIIKNLNNVNNIINEKNSSNIINAMTNPKINLGYKKKINILNNPYIHNNNFNNNVNIKLNNFYINNNNYNYNYNNMNLINYNYQYNNNVKSFNYLLTYYYYYYRDKLKNVQTNINDLEKQIKTLENKTLSEMILSYQKTDLVNFLKNKTKDLINDNNISLKNEKEEKNPEHPYFYTNHNEEIQIKNVLYLIEGLFYEDNLKKDYYLLNMLNRDGYASLKQLEKHPQLSMCKIAEVHLKTVFSEHRDNEVTETVETFDDILIRNKNWIKIKKEANDIENIKRFNINSMKNIKNYQMQKLLDKKQNLLNIKGEILNQYQLNYFNLQQKMNEFQIKFNNNIYNNYNNNIYNNNYNNNFPNFIYNNNNVYNTFYNNKHF
jgi:hypothetical protein